MAEYKIGDVVKVRSDLEHGKRYGDDSFIGCMSSCVGKVVTIREITRTGKYKLVEDLSRCNWTDEMFLGIVDESVVDAEILDETRILKRGDKVIVRQDLNTLMCFQGWNITRHMMKYTNQEVVISIMREDSDGIYYEIEEDDGRSCWTCHMFSHIKSGRSIHAEGISKALKNFSDEQLKEELERRKEES